MARILMTWELGAGRGHLLPMRSLAIGLRAAGHELELAVRDPSDAGPFLEPFKLRFHTAPIPVPPGNAGPLASYPQILQRLRFDEPAALQARVGRWHDLFDQLQADVIVCDHSPTALLAARARGLKAVATGTGFFVPPDISPLPDLRPWQPSDPQALAGIESSVLNGVNAVLTDLGGPPLARLGELFTANGQALFTLKELDNYAAWRQAEYWGPVPTATGTAPEWPTGDGKRIYAYLRRFETLPALLGALRASGQPTLIYMPQQPPDLISEFEGGNLHFSPAPLDIPTVAAECDLAILHGGHGVTTAMLLAGKPLLLLPLHLEMLLTARAVALLGAGLAAPQLKPGGMHNKLMRLLNEPAFSEAAQQFAAGYADLDTRNIPARFAALIERVIGN